MLREAGESRDSGGRTGHGVSARRRVAVAGAVGVVVAALSPLVLPVALAPLTGWDVAAVTFVLWVWLSIWRLDGQQTARHAEREDPTRAASDAVLLSAAVVSLAAIGFVIVQSGSGGGLQRGVQIGFGIASVVLSWSVIHTVFTLRYARMYYEGGDGGIDFHDRAKPRYSDFAYLAFTVGMTFQVSDTEVNASAIRATILRHALLSYLFGTVIIALTINLVAGLTK
ncbi:DUF1345 domain-containing protein [Planosporangium thailandense]|uniref:DUF1345 domain-containing protein n=1 Tax=Planosporangium thailandense TaxID=765197 RepID=A0ABX0Y1Z4_9ACTN|nr:DUF1345 domain-containing protein [Planosporangium thailandense]NJC72374.1 DUF1345 domain-containing protein [Planosporangium thailandense]